MSDGQLAIYKITCSLKRGNQWPTVNPEFEGRFVVREDGILGGYCDELNEGFEAKLGCRRYLFGACAPVEATGRHGILSYMLSNQEEPPIMLYKPSIRNEDAAPCWWGALGSSLILNNWQNYAKIDVEELPYSTKEAQRIVAEFKKVDIGQGSNLACIGNVGMCFGILGAKQPEKPWDPWNEGS